MRLGEAYLVSTRGFISEIDDNSRALMMEIAISEIGRLGKNQYGELLPDMIVFDPRFESTKVTRIYEDDNRTLRIAHMGPKVYAKLDDYHSPEILSEQVGHRVNTRYVLTFMLASEY